MDGNVRPFPMLGRHSRIQAGSLARRLIAEWTCASAGLEGNTFSLGDTDFFLREGLTVAGKTFREHCEIKGMRMHSNGWTTLSLPIPRFARNHLFTLHRFIQTETVTCSYTLGRTRKLRTKFTAETIKEKRLNKIYLLKKWQQVYHASCPASREQGSLVLNFKAL